jgi:mevalonate kinase
MPLFAPKPSSQTVEQVVSKVQTLKQRLKKTDETFKELNDLLDENSVFIDKETLKTVRRLVGELSARSWQLNVSTVLSPLKERVITVSD